MIAAPLYRHGQRRTLTMTVADKPGLIDISKEKATLPGKLESLSKCDVMLAPL
ncbi:MAG: hypothetical protein F6K11_29415 [Leptolyngbya sp. SIO3F4]|nr:hypothetical protein [Leptolyngbya sp. SIO3F4]